MLSYFPCWNHVKSPFSRGFPRVFPLKPPFSPGFPWVFPWFHQPPSSAPCFAQPRLAPEGPGPRSAGGGLGVSRDRGARARLRLAARFRVVIVVHFIPIVTLYINGSLYMVYINGHFRILDWRYLYIYISYISNLTMLQLNLKNINNLTMWGPPVISWFISPSNYSYKYI